MSLVIDQLTPIQQRMLNVLKDGLPHHRNELQACLDDELASPKAMVRQLSQMRKLLRMKGLNVVCRAFGGRSYYRWQLIRLYLPDE